MERQMSRASLSSIAASPQRSRWLTRGASWLARWWNDRNQCRQALAAVDDDELSELSELGRQLRREQRDRHPSAAPGG
jgi:hypothetical protein